METPPSAASPSVLRQRCTVKHWPAAECCSPKYVKRFQLSRWTQLKQTSYNQTLLFPKPWHDKVRHVYGVEPLSVAAFVAAILAHKQQVAASGWVLDIGMNLGWYTLLAANLAPELNVVSVDMQPKCADVVACGLRLNSGRHAMPPRVQLHTNFVSGTESGPIQVPDHACAVMASPSAVAGRAPDGRLSEASHALNVTKRTPVWPILLGAHLLRRLRPGERIAATKIDTEGYETRALQSLLPVWDRMDDVIFELQPRAWAYHGVSVDEGLEVLRAIIRHNRYRVVSLPHTALGTGQGESFRDVQPELVNPCRLPRLNRSQSVSLTGLTTAAVFGMHHLTALVQAQLQQGTAQSLFNEFMLTRRGSHCS